MPEQFVTLSVPATASYARCVRMLAANLAVIGGMSVDEVDDVRMASEEGFVFACSTHPEMCELNFRFDASKLVMSFSLGDEAPGALSMSDDDSDVNYAELLLQAVCDTYYVEKGILYLTLKMGGANA